MSLKVIQILYWLAFTLNQKCPKMMGNQGGFMSGKEDAIVAEGTVLDAQKNIFRVQIEGEGHIVQAHLGGRLRKNYIKIVPGDRVQVEMSPYDLSRGRIIYRMS
jgi:translation initiation factor IF-1